MDEEQYQKSSKSPEKKLKTVEFKKKKCVRFLLPHKADKEKKSSSLGETEESKFRCECQHCQMNQWGVLQYFDTISKGENKMQWPRKNKRMFQKVLYEWTE